MILAQNQTEPRIWNLRKVNLTQLRGSCPHRIVPSGSRLLASQMVHRTPKMVPLPPKRVTIKKEKEVDNNESSSSTGLSDEILCDHRSTVYGKDSTAVHKVRAKILSLEAGTKPSQQDIDSSPIFALRRVADESRSPSIIGQHWVPYLEQKGHLADCKPKDFTYKDGWLPLYTRAGITKHLSGLESLLNRDKTSPLIAVILPKMDFQYE